jgi:hypothetical protein
MRVNSLAFSPDGRLLASASVQGAQLWDATTGRQLRLADRFKTEFHRVTFSPDGRFVAASGFGVEAYVWEVATGDVLWVFAKRGHSTRTVAFSPDGRRLVVGYKDHTILVWEFPPWKAVLPHFDPGPLSPAERKGVADLLGDPMAERGYKAVCLLAAFPEQAIPLLRESLHPVPPRDTVRVRRLVADLDSADFETREAAVAELKKLGLLAEPELREALAGAPSAEVRRQGNLLLEAIDLDPTGSRRLAEVRAVFVLEIIGSPPARQILETLARGEPLAPSTRDAKAALERLSRHPR